MTRVLVLHNEPQSLPTDPAAASEHAIVAHAAAHAEALGRLGYGADILALGPDPAFLWHELKRRRPDVVLNLYEGTLDDPETETYVAGLLQWSRIPFTGCPVPSLTLARSKPNSKRVLKAAGLPTADFCVLRPNAPPRACTIPFPVFVKPAEQDASVGIDRDSICRNAGRARAARASTAGDAAGPAARRAFPAGPGDSRRRDGAAGARRVAGGGGRLRVRAGRHPDVRREVDAGLGRLPGDADAFRRRVAGEACGRARGRGPFGVRGARGT